MVVLDVFTGGVDNDIKMIDVLRFVIMNGFVPEGLRQGRLAAAGAPHKYDLLHVRVSWQVAKPSVSRQ
jgi:hypothetical protein